MLCYCEVALCIFIWWVALIAFVWLVALSAVRVVLVILCGVTFSGHTGVTWIIFKAKWLGCVMLGVTLYKMLLCVRFIRWVVLGAMRFAAVDFNWLIGSRAVTLEFPWVFVFSSRDTFIGFIMASCIGYCHTESCLVCCHTASFFLGGRDALYGQLL